MRLYRKIDLAYFFTPLLPGDVNQVHEGVDQGAGDLWGGQPLHGFWHSVPPPLGWNLCLERLLMVGHHT